MNYEVEYYQLNNVVMKKWYTSKTVWFNLLMTIIGLATAFQGAEVFAKYAEGFGLIVLAGNVILRVWFTSTKIQ